MLLDGVNAILVSYIANRNALACSRDMNVHVNCLSSACDGGYRVLYTGSTLIGRCLCMLPLHSQSDARGSMLYHRGESW